MGKYGRQRRERQWSIKSRERTLYQKLKILSSLFHPATGSDQRACRQAHRHGRGIHMGTDRRSKGHSKGHERIITHVDPIIPLRLCPHLALACAHALSLSHPLPGTHGRTEAPTLTHKPQVHAHPQTPILLISIAQTTLPHSWLTNTGKGIHPEVDAQVIRILARMGGSVGGPSPSESRKRNSGRGRAGHPPLKLPLASHPPCIPVTIIALKWVNPQGTAS
jgi:hypothetical protein